MNFSKNCVNQAITAFVPSLSAKLDDCSNELYFDFLCKALALAASEYFIAEAGFQLDVKAKAAIVLSEAHSEFVNSGTFFFGSRFNTLNQLSLNSRIVIKFGIDT